MRKNEVLGALLVIVGILFFARAFGLIDFSIFYGLQAYWPVGIILVGLAMMVRWGNIAVFILVATLIIAAFSHADTAMTTTPREVIQEVAFVTGVTTAELELNYGAGDVTIAEGSADFILKNVITTADIVDPKLEYETEGSEMDITISRDGKGASWWNTKDKWDMTLSPDVTYTLDLDYGATDLNLDLTNLKVDSIDIDSGASSADIKFGEYPTKVTIDTGASSLDFKFPKDIGVKVHVEGGAISTDLDDFTKEDKDYLYNYDEGKNNIEIIINAGASSIKGELYWGGE